MREGKGKGREMGRKEEEYWGGGEERAAAKLQARRIASRFKGCCLAWSELANKIGNSLAELSLSGNLQFSVLMFMSAKLPSFLSFPPFLFLSLFFSFFFFFFFRAKVFVLS